MVWPAGAQDGNSLLVDGGFELSPTGNGWSVDPSVAAEGKAFRSTTAIHSGRFSLEVAPTGQNTWATRLDSFALVQLIPADKLRGNPVYFGGYLWARDGATAILRIWTVGNSAIELREVRQVTGTSGPVLLRDVLDVPTDPSVTAIAVGCVVEGTTGAAYFDDVSVTTSPPDYVTALSSVNSGPALQATVDISPTEVTRRIPNSLYGVNIEWGWDAQGIWNEQAQAPYPGVIDLIQELGFSEFRFPGGILSDLYNWQDGTGPVADRPGPVTMPGGSLSTNGFGTDELLQLADATGANLMMTANVLTGTPDEAAAWMSYLTGHGHRVQNWEVGNELYLDFTQFTPPSANWTAEQYAQTFLQYATAMRAADPGVRLGAGLEYSLSPSAFRVHPNWEQTVLQIAGSQIDFVAVHNAFAPVLPIEDAGWDARTVYESLFAAPILIKQSLDQLSSIIDANAGPNAQRIGIGVTEWGPGFKIEPDSRWVDHLKTLGSAIYAADVLKAFIDSPRVERAHAFKLADGSAQGWIGVRNSAFLAKPVAQALEMYVKHFGTQRVNSLVASPTYESRSMGLVDAVQAVPYLDVVCSLDDSGQTLYVMAINKHIDRDIRATIELGGYMAYGTATVWTLNGTGVDANPGTQLPTYITWAPQTGIEPNPRIDDGGPGEVTLSPDTISLEGMRFEYTFPAHSVTSLVIPIAAIDGGSPQ